MYVPSLALSMLALVVAQAPIAAQAYGPRVNYQLQCMGCHGASGSGESGHVPSVRNSLVAFSMVPQGREFVLRVPGVAQSSLSDQQVAELLNWMVRNLSDVPLPQQFVDYTAAEVAGPRRQPLTATIAARKKLLAELGSDLPTK